MNEIVFVTGIEAEKLQRLINDLHNIVKVGLPRIFAIPGPMPEVTVKSEQGTEVITLAEYLARLAKQVEVGSSTQAQS